MATASERNRRILARLVAERQEREQRAKLRRYEKRAADKNLTKGQRDYARRQIRSNPRALLHRITGAPAGTYTRRDYQRDQRAIDNLTPEQQVELARDAGIEQVIPGFNSFRDADKQGLARSYMRSFMTHGRRDFDPELVIDRWTLVYNRIPDAYMNADLDRIDPGIADYWRRFKEQYAQQFGGNSLRGVR